MPSAAEGGGGTSTNWREYDVPAMWSMIEDFDATPQWRHVDGWRKASELTSMHLGRMRSYRDQLATAWPPERNEASRVYLAELDKLISSLQATYDAAVANHSTMATATSALSGARHQLEPIYDRWQAYASTMAEYEAKLAAARSGTPTPMPGPPPLPPNWRDKLNAEARAVMDSTSSEIALASYRVTTPPPYSAPNVSVIEEKQIESPGTVLVSPLIPPVKSRPAQSSISAEAPGQPVLAGSPPYRELSPMPSVDRVPTGPSSSLDPIPGVIGPVPVGPRPGRTSANLPATMGPGTQPPVNRIGRAMTAPAEGAPGPVGRGLPPGGVIGAPPPVGLGQPAARPIQRVNPVGGIIGGAMGPGTAGAPPARGAPTPPTNAHRLTGATYRTPDGHLVSISAGRGQRRQEQARSQQWDPDNPWVTQEGVPPVVEPSAGPSHHDPGPAIGLDR